MRFAGVDDGLQLGVGKQRGDVRWQHWPIAGLGRRDARHRRRLHQLGRMGLRAGNTDRLQSVFLIDRLGQVCALRRRPVHDVIGQRDAFGIDAGRGIGANGCRAREIAAHGLQWRRDRHGYCGQRDRQPGRHMRADPVEQRSGVGRHARRGREQCRIVGGQLVDDRQPRWKGRAVFGIDRAGNRGAEHDAAARLQADEGLAPVGHIRADVRAGDGDETPAGREPVQR